MELTNDRETNFNERKHSTKHLDQNFVDLKKLDHHLKMQNDLLNEEPQKQEASNSHKTLYIILAIAAVICTIVVVVLVCTIGKTGKINVLIKTVDLPSNVSVEDAHYLPNGRIFLHYFADKNKTEYHAAVMDENGNNFHDVYSGTYKAVYRANGIRDIPFSDNKRILLGDYILECEQELQDCDNKATLKKIIYPEEFVNASTTYLVWSEPVVSQDSKKLAWTMLDTKIGAVNFIADLVKSGDEYKLTNHKIISSLTFVTKDESTGYLKLNPIRGGEIKQFVNGGLALTLAGGGDSGLARSVFQGLSTDELYSITNKPGYDETTIMSPDEKLGISMSTRFSPHTNMAIFGHMFISHSFIVTSAMNQYSYAHAVTNVRTTLPGNIGPVLIELSKSINDKSYMGINLNEDPDWSFASPISWHYSSLRALWMEVSKNNETRGKKRIRKVIISGYTPKKRVETQPTPDKIDYAIDPSEYFKLTTTDVSGILKGAKSGEISVSYTRAARSANYTNFSDDGKTTYDGTISFTSDRSKGTAVYTINLTAKGDMEGKADFQVTFNKDNNIVWDNDATRGSCTYNGETIDVSLYKL